MSANYDVVIVGGGIAGLSLASALAGKCSVALVEAEQTLAYHTSARSARQLIPSYGPPAVQELTAPHPRTHRRPGRRPAGTCAHPAQLHADRRRRRRPGTGQRPHAADHPRRGPGTLPGPGPGLLLRCRPGHRLLRLQRAPAARGPPPARRSRRRGHHHRRPGPLGPAPRLRLGTRRRAGRLPGRRCGQRRRRLGRRTCRAQRRREGPAAAVPAHRGDCRRRTSPPGQLPHGGRRRRLLLLPAATATRS